MRVLVTGGAGFIGSHLVERLLSQGIDVVVLDNLSTGRQHNLTALVSHGHGRSSLASHVPAEPITPSFPMRGMSHVEGPGELQDRSPGPGGSLSLVQGSILDQDTVLRAAADCTIIYHLAAAIGVRYIVDDPLQSIITNVQGTENVVAAAAHYGCRLVVASSSEVYGKSKAVPFREDGDSVIGPTSIGRWSYAHAKALDEHLALAYSRQRGLRTAIVRYFNVYGPRQELGGYAVVARFVVQALLGRSLTVHGDGQQTRCFTYVDDAVEATLRAATTDGALGEVFNVGSTCEVSIANLAQRIINVVGGGLGIAYQSHEQVYGRGFEDTQRRVPDVTKAERLLGFRAQVSLDDGLEASVAWWRQRAGRETLTIAD